MNLYLLIELITTGFKTVFIFLLSLVSIYFALMTVIALNPVISVLYLIGLFVAIALYLMMLGLDFLGISYLLVYVGAISILFIFILMLINVRVSELLTEGINGATLALIAVVTFSFNVGGVLPYYLHISDAFSNYLTYISIIINNSVSTALNSALNGLSLMEKALVESANVTSKSWDGSLIEINHISSIGNILYSKLFIFLILISFILLLAMVGTIVITLKRETNLKQLNLESHLAFAFRLFTLFRLFCEELKSKCFFCGQEFTVGFSCTNPECPGKTPPGSPLPACTKKHLSKKDFFTILSFERKNSKVLYASNNGIIYTNKRLFTSSSKKNTDSLRTRLFNEKDEKKSEILKLIKEIDTISTQMNYMIDRRSDTDMLLTTRIRDLGDRDRDYTNKMKEKFHKESDETESFSILKELWKVQESFLLVGKTTYGKKLEGRDPSYYENFETKESKRNSLIKEFDKKIQDYNEFTKEYNNKIEQLNKEEKESQEDLIDLSDKSSKGSSNKPKGSLIDDYADPSLEQPSYMDPED